MQTNHPHTHPRNLSATSLIGGEVWNPEGERLGTIKELMIDLNTGQVAYAVLSISGFLGLNEKLFALPWLALDVDTEHRCFLLDVEKEWLKVAPGFDKDHWPETPDRRFVHDLYEHQGAVRRDTRNDARAFDLENRSNR